MTTVRQATQHGAARPRQGSPGGTVTTRQIRRLEHRRIVREEVLAVIVLAALLVVTLVLLGLQWLDTGTPSASALAHLRGGVS